ncbi:hypothetical protein I553_8709 [Mycobacterium xenopi 4042]|uniref:Uncharacterized protein n=1 Tax=Mycobacterium xenopi 4042 TaxID=1299334 RepID=X8CJW1_MYCXE|nr:hypothetical protein I553_8709 [Mycobacterium xenopi 4042]
MEARRGYVATWRLADGVRSVFLHPYIKIRGKVYAFTIRDSRPDPPSDGGWRSHGAAPDSDATPDSYGGLATAKKSWWLLILIVTICAINVIGYFVDKQHPWRAALMASVIVAISTMFGYGDASWGYPVARRQRMQLFILSVITLGAFTALYLCAYCAGKRWPLSRKQSMEHRRPPRHQKQYP